MLNLLINYTKPLKVNGKVYPDGRIANAALQKYKGKVEIELNFETEEIELPGTFTAIEDTTYKIKVRKYMCNKEFDFHNKWNNGNPMPMRIMQGTILQETKGMYKMRLQGKIEPSNTCLHCGRKLTNPVSFNYGIGPICGEHFNIAEPKTLEEFKQRKKQIQQQLEQATAWEGWVIKKAIENKEEVQNGQGNVHSFTTAQ